MEPFAHTENPELLNPIRTPATTTSDALMVDRLQFLCDSLARLQERKATVTVVWSSHGAASVITGSVETLTSSGVSLRGMILAPPQSNQLGVAFIPLVDIARLVEPSLLAADGIKG